MDSSMVKKVAQYGYKLAKDAIKKDRANRYSLLQDWTLPTVRCCILDIVPFDYVGRYIRICKASDGEGIVITVLAYESSAENNICDGASLSPDWKGALEGSLFHDVWYLELDDMATATGISTARLRKLGDAVFGNIIQALGERPWYARIYYTAVRWFGGVARGHLKTIIITLLALTLAGCSGCAIPGLFDDGDIVPPPSFEKVAP